MTMNDCNDRESSLDRQEKVAWMKQTNKKYARKQISGRINTKNNLKARHNLATDIKLASNKLLRMN